MFWELHQQHLIAEAQTDARQSRDKAEDAVDRLRDLEGRLDRLTLINMALWSLLKDAAGLTEEDLIQRVQEIDLTDGKLDGKIRSTVTNCPQCRRSLSRKHNRCLFCGYAPPGADAFQSVAR